MDRNEMILPRLVFLTGLVLIAIKANAQTSDASRPAVGVRLSAGAFLQAPVRIYDRTGPLANFDGVAIGSHRLAAEGTIRLSGSGSLRMGASWERLPFSYSMDRQLSAVLGPAFGDFGSGRERWIITWTGLWQVRLGYEHILARWDRHTVRASGFAGMAWAYKDDGMFTGTIGDSLTVFMRSQVRIGEGRGANPMYGAELSFARTLKNMNTLFIGIVIQRSTSADIINGSWVLYPQREQESRARFTSGLNSVGVALAYELTWGYPKLPKYLRNADQ